MENKKNLSIYIYKILKEQSDEKHMLKYGDIIDILDRVYNIKSGRNAIGRNIDSLIVSGYDIVKSKSGCYLAERDFEDSEIEYLIDSIYSSKSIPYSYANKLIEKLCHNFSVYRKDRFKFVYSSNNVESINRTSNKQVFYNLDLINEAIEKNLQLEFTYNTFDENKKLVPRKEHSYIVSPYFMVNNNGKYYLVANNNKYYNLSHYRIDYITNIKILNNKIKPLNSLYGYEEGVDKAKYINEHIYMFGGKTIEAIIRISHIDALNAVFDWFGLGVEVQRDNFGYTVKLSANENALYYWLIQYGENVELVSPKTLREKLKNFANNLAKKYSEI